MSAFDSAKHTIIVNGIATIGRDADNDIVIDNQAVSRCHALLLPQPGDVALIDLESTNGTYINDVLAPPDQRVYLKDGDLIRIGAVLLRYEAAADLKSSVPSASARPTRRYVNLDRRMQVMLCTV